MARPIVLSNGRMHVGLNNYGLVHDFYFPYVGFENHSAGKDLRHRIGVWCDGQLSWLDDEQWQFSFNFAENSLIGLTTASHDELGIKLEFRDVVDKFEHAFIRQVKVYNSFNHQRDVRVFMHQAFVIGDSRSNTDTAQYLPDNKALLHYRGHRAFVIGGRDFDQYTIGLFGIESREGTYKDAEDGELSSNNVEHGQVDSTIRFKLSIPAESSSDFEYWIAAGESRRMVLDMHKNLSDLGVDEYFNRTARWWEKWLAPAIEISYKLPEDLRTNFVNSAMIIKSQIDSRGAIIASTDSAMLNYSRDNYSYCWPRDAALVLWPLVRMGYDKEPRRYFKFCLDNMHPSGYMDHKYRADGALGSSWHAYIHGDIIAPPIQIDETALTIFIFHQFYEAQSDSSLLADYYEPMIKPMTDFIANYIDRKTGLPKASYDLWEEKFLSTTFTTATVYGALQSAAELAEVVSDADSVVKWRTAAEDIRAASTKHLFNNDRGGFYKGLLTHEDGNIDYDDTIDSSSLYGAFMFGLFDSESNYIDRAIKTHDEIFNYSAQNPGIPRYEDDYYYRVSQSVTGNWWFITSLWRAQYFIEQGDKERAFDIVRWVKGLSLESSVMSEQINPLDNSLLSVAPLTWSHAELVSTLLDSVGKD